MQPSIKDLSGGNGMKSKILGQYHAEGADYRPASCGTVLGPNHWPVLGASLRQRDAGQDLERDLIINTASLMSACS